MKSNIQIRRLGGFLAFGSAVLTALSGISAHADPGGGAGAATDPALKVTSYSPGSTHISNGGTISVSVKGQSTYAIKSVSDANYSSGINFYGPHGSHYGCSPGISNIQVVHQSYSYLWSVGCTVSIPPTAENGTYTGVVNVFDSWGIGAFTSGGTLPTLTAQVSNTNATSAPKLSGLTANPGEVELGHSVTISANITLAKGDSPKKFSVVSKYPGVLNLTCSTEQFGGSGESRTASCSLAVPNGAPVGANQVTATIDDLNVPSLSTSATTTFYTATKVVTKNPNQPH